MKTIRDFERYLLNNCIRNSHHFDEDFEEAGFKEPAYQADFYHFDEDLSITVVENSRDSRFESGFHKKYEIHIEENGEEIIYYTDSLSEDFEKIKKFLMKKIEASDAESFNRAINVLFDFEIGGWGMMYDYR